MDSQAERGIPNRPGVNWLERVARSDGSGEWDFREEDACQHLAAVKRAASAAEFVVVYIHHHTLGATPERVPSSYRNFSRSCIKAGASVVLGHGVPVVQGLEVYEGRPIFYNLANFVFHTQAVEMWSGRYGAKPWESCIASARFLADGSLAALEILPVTLGEPETLAGQDWDGRRKTYPVAAEGERRNQILRRLAGLSQELGTALETNEMRSDGWAVVWTAKSPSPNKKTGREFLRSFSPPWRRKPEDQTEEGRSFRAS